MSILTDGDATERLTPIGRAPVVVLDDGSTLPDSASILDYFDEIVGPNRALFPLHDTQRHKALQVVALATDTAERAISLIRTHPAAGSDTQTAGSARILSLVNQGLTALKKKLGGQINLGGARIMQADIATAVVATMIRKRLPQAWDESAFAELGQLTDRCEETHAVKCWPGSPV